MEARREDFFALDEKEVRDLEGEREGLKRVMYAVMSVGGGGGSCAGIIRDC